MGNAARMDMCHLVFVLKLPRFNLLLLFLCSVLLALIWCSVVCFSLVDCHWLLFSTWLCVQGAFQMCTSYQPSKHGISLPFNSIYGIKAYPFQPGMLLCKYQQVSSRASFPNERQVVSALLKAGFWGLSKATGYVGKEEKGWCLQIPLVFELIHMI